LIKSGRTREAQRYLRENPEANLYVLSGKYENSVRKLRKQRREMKERDLPRQQIETIENLIRSQMEKLNNMVKKYKWLDDTSWFVANSTIDYPTCSASPK